MPQLNAFARDKNGDEDGQLSNGAIINIRVFRNTQCPTFSLIPNVGTINESIQEVDVIDLMPFVIDADDSVSGLLF